MRDTQTRRMPKQNGGRLSQQDDGAAEATHLTPSEGGTLIDLNYNWYWVDVVGRDEQNKRKDYNRVMERLTEEYGLCPTFLVDRDYKLFQTQFLESADYATQFMIVLRVANAQISLADDSLGQLTNRWLIVVDTHQKVILTIHRYDTSSMANLRAYWKHIMTKSDVSFEQFILGIIDDAVATYQLSIDVHNNILDVCEVNLLRPTSAMRAAQTDEDRELSNETKRAVLTFFDETPSTFLQNMLRGDTRKIDKGEMNAFLYHLQRRCGVMHRSLIQLERVIVTAITEMRLCSQKYSHQMASYCSELQGRAQEIRDDAEHFLDMHINLQSFRTNELMAILTRFSIFFTPTGFLAGVYGMNFTYMPGSMNPFGFWYFCIACLSILVAMTVFFYRKVS